MSDVAAPSAGPAHAPSVVPRRPTEFRYVEHASRPGARRVRSAVKTLLGLDLEPPPDVVEAIGAMYYDADPLAEAFVDDVYLRRGAAAGRAMLDAALASGVASLADAPESLVRLFADLEQAPAWLDLARVEHGARVFRRYGPEMFRLAGAVTLEAYSESSVAKPLALSGGYQGDSTRKRFLETVAFWLAVSAPHGLEPGAEGRAAAMRVRMMHVFVRRRLLGHREWDLDAWGVPISQADATLTLMGGSFVPGLMMRLLGHRPSRQDVEASMHFWRWVGHLMGVRPRWYPETMEEAAQLLWVARLKGVRRAGDDGVRLCQSFARAFESAGPLENKLHLGFTRFFLSKKTYEANAMPPAGLWALAPLTMFPVVFTAETLRRRVPSLEGVADRVATRRARRFYERHAGGAHAEFHAPAAFTR